MSETGDKEGEPGLDRAKRPFSALRTATYAEFEKARHSASTFAAASPLVHWAKAELEQGPKAESKSNRPFFD